MAKLFFPSAMLYAYSLRFQSYKIQAVGFYDAFQRLGHETHWVDDSEESQKLLSPGSIVVAVNVASKYLVKEKKVK